MSLRNHARRVHQHLARQNQPQLNAREAQPEAMAQRNRNDDDDSQPSVVFVTAAKTFDGPAVMVTNVDVGPPLLFSAPDAEPSPEPRPRPRPQPRPEVQDDSDRDEGRNADDNRENDSRGRDEGRSEDDNRENDSRGGDDRDSDDFDDTQPVSRPPPIPIRSEARPNTADAEPTGRPAPVETGPADSLPPSQPPQETSTPDIPGVVDDADGEDTGGELASLTGGLEPSATAIEASDDDSGGLSGGATAGIVIGVLLAVGALIALGFFYARKKRREREGVSRLQDEKSDASFGQPATAVAVNAPALTSTASMRTARTASTAPRLSLRPLTAFVPNLGSENRNTPTHLEMQSAFSPSTVSGTDNHNSRLPPSPPTMRSPELPSSPGQRTANDPENPFGNHAETIEKSPIVERTLTAPQLPPPEIVSPMKTDSVSIISGAIPAEQNTSQPSRPMTPASPAPASSVPASPAQPMKPPVDQGMAAAMAARSAPSAPEKPFAAPPKPLSMHSAVSVPLALGSPARADYGDTASIVSDGSAATPNRSPMPNNVFRVEMDYKPAMEDELEIRAGQLIRLLHEYDDGWGLCIRMDRSQQGVVPRTCLSAQPVKPRPIGPNGPKPNGRPSLPPGGPPNGPPRGQGMGPPRGLGSPGPRPGSGSRPQTPTGAPAPGGVVFPTPPRPMSPGPRVLAMPPHPMSPTLHSGRNSPVTMQQQQQQPRSPRQFAQQRMPSPQFHGQQPPRSLSPGPYAAYRRPSVPDARRRSNSTGGASAIRAGDSAKRMSPLSSDDATAPAPLNLPSRKPVPGVAM